MFDALSADPSTWTWFPGFRGGGYEGDAPYGVGTKRWIRMTGSTYRETVVAWDRPRQWAYRVDSSTVPLARHLVETWRVRPADTGTNSVVSWEFAIEPRLLFRAMSPVAPPVMGALFRRAMRNLERSLRNGG